MKRFLNHPWLMLTCLLGLFGCQPEDYRLLEAIENGETEAVRNMLEKGVPADEVPEGAEFFPLEVAAAHNQAVMVQMLIGYGGHPDSARSGVSPLWRAIDLNAQSAAVALLEGGATADDSTREGLTQLMQAAAFGLDSVVSALIENGAEINPVEPNLRPLGEAVSAGQYKTVELLLKAGGNPDLPDQALDPPIFSAFQLDSLDIAQLLLDYGAGINQGDPNGWSLAFQQDFMTRERLEKAIEWGLDLELQDKWGDTPLHNAVLNGWTSHVETLRDLGANRKALNAKGQTPVRAAEVNGKPEFVRLLEE